MKRRRKNSKDKIRAAIFDFDFDGYVSEKFDNIYPTGKSYRVRTHCPFCSSLGGSDDKRGHFYIHMTLRLVYCQRCKYDPKWLPKFISDLENISLDEAISFLTDSDIYLGNKKTVEDIVGGILVCKEDEADEFEYLAIELGGEFVSILERTGIPVIDSNLSEAQKYLNGRKVTDEDIALYDIRYCYSGEFSGRIIIPTYWQGDLVTFVARGIFPWSSDPPYLNLSANEQGNFLFNYSRVRGGKVIVTEGVFDAIACGFDAVASFGKSLSARQLSLLNSFSEVIFYWDTDAYPQLDKYVPHINGVVKKVLHKGKKDAGDRSFEENRNLIQNAVYVKSVDSTIFGLR